MQGNDIVCFVLSRSASAIARILNILWLRRCSVQLCRFNDNRIGIVEGSGVCDVTEALDVLPAYHYPLPSFDVLIANLDKFSERARAIAANSPLLDRKSTRLNSSNI